MFSRTSKKAGFTLIEMLIAVGLVSFVFAATAAALFQGIRVYHRLINVSESGEVLIFFEKVSKDVSNSLSYSGVPFNAGASGMSFAALREPASWDTQAFAATVVRVDYSLNSKNGNVLRTETELPTGKLLSREIVLSGVREWRFEADRGAGKAPFPLALDVQIQTNLHGSYQRKIWVPLNYAIRN